APLNAGRREGISGDLLQAVAANPSAVSKFWQRAPRLQAPPTQTSATAEDLAERSRRIDRCGEQGGRLSVEVREAHAVASVLGARVDADSRRPPDRRAGPPTI